MTSPEELAMSGDEFVYRVLETEAPKLTQRQRTTIGQRIGSYLTDRILAVKHHEGKPEHSILNIGATTVEFTHTAENLNAHLFIGNQHDPALCPECIRPGTLQFGEGIV